MSSSVLAQTAGDPRQPLSVYWQDGLFLENADGDVQIRLGALVRFEGKFPLSVDSSSVFETLQIRNARLVAQGRLGKYFSFRLVPDFSGSQPPLADAYFELGLSDAVHVRAGRDKPPLGFEILLQDANVLFIERGASSQLLPARDVGTQVWGDIGQGRATYAAGIYNGVPDGTTGANTDSNAGKDLVGRILVRPFCESRASRAPAFWRWHRRFTRQSERRGPVVQDRRPADLFLVQRRC